MKYYYQKSLEKVLERAGGRKIIIYGTDILSEIIYYNLVDMNVEVKYFVSDSPQKEERFCEKVIKTPYDLLYENKNEIYVIVFVLKDHKDYYQALIEMQFIYLQDFCVHGIGGYFMDFDAVDSLLGYTRRYDGIPGFMILGNPDNENAIRILTLGGSTSEPTVGNYISWPEQLYERISIDQDVVLYSGGMGGYGIQQEFLKFVRDGLTFNPDILITFDGYNDAVFISSYEGYPMLHNYQKRFFDYVKLRRPMAPDSLDMRDVQEITHGIPRNRDKYSDVQNWVDGIRKIHAIAEEFGIQHFAFFQPMVAGGKAIIDESVKLVFKEYLELWPNMREVNAKIPEYIKGCQKQIANMPYITDLSDIFDYQEDIFYDTCHVTDKGNRIIMENIYQHIENTIKEFKRGERI